MADSEVADFPTCSTNNGWRIQCGRIPDGEESKFEIASSFEAESTQDNHLWST
jgi:hypothetical protein